MIQPGLLALTELPPHASSGILRFGRHALYVGRGCPTGGVWNVTSPTPPRRGFPRSVSALGSANTEALERERRGEARWVRRGSADNG